MDAKAMATNLKDNVYDISSLDTSATSSIDELNTSVAYTKKAANTAISILGSLSKK